MFLSYGVKTNVGRKRDHNEDFVAFFDPTEDHDLQRSGELFIVADGVGGASHGERASKYAAEKVLYDYYNFSDISPGQRLQQIIQAAGNQINSFAEEGEHFIRMATTMVAATIIEDNLVVANVGDSRAYLIRNNVANQISKDHSFVGEMVRDGLMTEEEARTSKQKNRITRSLGGERDVRVDLFEGIKLADGDKILLCSDGFSQYAPNEIIVHLSQNGTAEEIAEKMIAYANQQGGSDNISVILIKVGSSPLEETLSMRQPKQDLSVQPTWGEFDTDPGKSEGKAGIFALIAKVNTKQKIALIFLPLVLIFVVFLWILPDLTPAASPPPANLAAATESFPTPFGELDQPTTIPLTGLPVTETPALVDDVVATEIIATVTPTLPPNICRYTLSESDAIDFYNNMPHLFFTKFNIDINKFVEQLAALVVCSEIEGNTLCKYDAEWNGNRNVYNFKSDWIIEFPLQKFSVTEEDCKHGGGKPILTEPPQQ